MERVVPYGLVCICIYMHDILPFLGAEFFGQYAVVWVRTRLSIILC